MEYRFLDRGDEALIALSELPCERGIAFAVRSTGYEQGAEVVELAIVDLDGNELFSQKVKPQNAESWEAGAASGGLSAEDVAEAPELFQFEDEITSLFEEAAGITDPMESAGFFSQKSAESQAPGALVAEHVRFSVAAIESSWVSLPSFEGTDLVELFCQSHCTTDYPGEPATAAALPGIAAYYGLSQPDGTAIGEAQLVAACYRALVAEHQREREAKGAAHWERYDKGKEQERVEAARVQEVKDKREHRLNQMNGLLWIAGALIFVSLAIQLYQRGGDIGAIIIAGAIAAFAAIRGIANFRK